MCVAEQDITKRYVVTENAISVIVRDILVKNVQMENIELGISIILMKSIEATVHLILGVIEGGVMTEVLAIIGTIVPGVVRTTALTLVIDREALVTGIEVPVIEETVQTVETNVGFV